MLDFSFCSRFRFRVTASASVCRAWPGPRCNQQKCVFLNLPEQKTAGQIYSRGMGGVPFTAADLRRRVRKGAQGITTRAVAERSEPRMKIPPPSIISSPPPHIAQHTRPQKSILQEEREREATHLCGFRFPSPHVVVVVHALGCSSSITTLVRSFVQHTSGPHGRVQASMSLVRRSDGHTVKGGGGRSEKSTYLILN